MTRPRQQVRTSRRPARVRQAGFTLVEVLATLALIGIVIPVAMTGVTVALDAASRARHQAEAATLAETKLSEIMTQGDWAFGGGGSGDFGADWPMYKWTCETANPDPNVNVTEVTVSVTWSQRGQEREYHVSTFAYANAEMTGGLP